MSRAGAAACVGVACKFLGRIQVVELTRQKRIALHVACSLRQQAWFVDGRSSMPQLLPHVRADCDNDLQALQ